MADGGDNDENVSELNLIAWTKGTQETGKLIIDRVLAGTAQGGRVMVSVGGKQYSGALNQFDGERLVVLHDTGQNTIIWVKSGVALTTVEDT